MPFLLAGVSGVHVFYELRPRHGLVRVWGEEAAFGVRDEIERERRLAVVALHYARQRKCVSYVPVDLESEVPRQLTDSVVRAPGYLTITCPCACHLPPVLRTSSHRV